MFKKGKVDKLSQYVDPTGEFSNRSLKMSEWYIKHKLLLRKIGLWSLSIWCVVSMGYSLTNWALYYMHGYFEDQDMMVRQTLELENYTNIQPLYEAQQLQVREVGVYNSVSELYDFTAHMFNPNFRWVAIVTYKFTFIGGETPLTQTMLMPKSERPIAYLGFEIDSYPSRPTLVIEKVDWKRISPHWIEDIDNYTEERIRFSIENFDFTRASKSAGVDNHMVEFDVFNDSAYNFWEPDFYVELIDGAETVGLIYFVLDEFRAGDEQHVDLRSFVNNMDVSHIKLWPLINVFDESEFMGVGD